MRNSTYSARADTPGTRNPIRVDRGDRHCADVPLPYLQRFEQAMERVFVAAFRQAEKGGQS